MSAIQHAEQLVEKFRAQERHCRRRQEEARIQAECYQDAGFEAEKALEEMKKAAAQN